jgi:hypothetical protein
MFAIEPSDEAGRTTVSAAGSRWGAACRRYSEKLEFE